MWEFIVSQSVCMVAGIVFFNEIISVFEISYPLNVLKRFKFNIIYLNWQEMKINIFFYAWASSAALANLRLCLPLWLFHFWFKELGALLTATTNKAIRITIDFSDIVYFSILRNVKSFFVFLLTEKLFVIKWKKSNQ